MRVQNYKRRNYMNRELIKFEDEWERITEIINDRYDNKIKGPTQPSHLLFLPTFFISFYQLFTFMNLMLVGLYFSSPFYLFVVYSLAHLYIFTWLFYNTFLTLKKPRYDKRIRDNNMPFSSYRILLKKMA